MKLFKLFTLCSLVCLISMSCKTYALLGGLIEDTGEVAADTARLAPFGAGEIPAEIIEDTTYGAGRFVDRVTPPFDPYY